MNSLALLIPLLLALALGASLLIWSQVVLRLARGQPLLLTSPRRDVPWRGVHVALAFLVYVIVPALSVVLIVQRFELPSLADLPTDDVQVVIWRLAAGSILVVVAALLVLTYLKIDLSATRSDLGWSAKDLPGDIGLGIRAFLAIAPPVYALQYVLVLVYQQFSDQPALHPLVQLVRQHPTPAMLFWSIVSAVLVAPVVEEFLFRVVLQGWLEKLVRGVHIAVQLARDSQTQAFQPPDTPPPDTEPPDPSSPDNPYLSPAATGDRPGLGQGMAAAPQRLIAAPIFISSALFALFHLGHGPAPIPLFFLALVLGYLYQKTHRILPSVVVHMLLNGTSLLGVWFGE